MFISKHRWHPEHRKCLFRSINDIRNIDKSYLTAELSTNSLGDLVVFWNYDIQTVVRAALAALAALAGTKKMLILKHNWHPEHRKCFFYSINGFRNIENVYFKT